MRTFRPEDVNVSLGTYRLTGFTEVGVRQNSKAFRHESGLRNKHTRVRLRDKSGSITLTMQQTAPDNDLLSQIVAQDVVSQTGRFELTITDTSGQSQLVFSEVSLEGYPDVTFQTEASAREWVFHYQDVVSYQVGGNSNSSIDLLTSLLS